MLKLLPYFQYILLIVYFRTANISKIHVRKGFRLRKWKSLFYDLEKPFSKYLDIEYPEHPGTPRYKLRGFPGKLVFVFLQIRTTLNQKLRRNYPTHYFDISR